MNRVFCSTLIILLLSFSIGFAQQIDIEYANESIEKQLLEKLSSKTFAISMIERIQDSIDKGLETALMLEEKKYYSFVLSLIDDIEDYTYYKINVLKENDEIAKQIKSWKPEDKIDFYSLNDLSIILIDNKKASRLFYEKDIILSRLQYDREILKERIKSQKNSIIKLKIQKNKLQATIKKQQNKEEVKNILNKIEELNNTINTKEKMIKAFEINIKLIHEKIPIAQIDKKAFKDLKDHTKKIIDITKKALFVTTEELEYKKIDLQGKRELMISKIDLVNSKIFEDLKKLGKEKEKRSKLYNAIKKETNENRGIELQYEYEISLYTINYLKAEIDYYETKKYYYQLEDELEQLKYKYLELYALESLRKLTVNELNQSSMLFSKKYNKKVLKFCLSVQ